MGEHMQRECPMRQATDLPPVFGPVTFGNHTMHCSECGLTMSIDFVHDPEDEEMQVWETR